MADGYLWTTPYFELALKKFCTILPCNQETLKSLEHAAKKYSWEIIYDFASLCYLHVWMVEQMHITYWFRMLWGFWAILEAIKMLFLYCSAASTSKTS